MSQYIKIKDNLIHLPSIKHAYKDSGYGFKITLVFKEGDKADIYFFSDVDARDDAFALLEEALINL